MKKQKIKLILSIIGIMISSTFSYAGLGFAQYYTGVSTEYIYDMGTECLTTIEHQYEVTECFSFLGICSEGNELIATHEETVCIAG